MGSISILTTAATPTSEPTPNAKRPRKQPRIYDLTHPLIPSQTPHCSGHPSYSCTPNLELLSKIGITVHELKLGTHTGTHIDAPYHFFGDDGEDVEGKRGGKKVDEIELEWLVNSRAVVVDVRRVGEGGNRRERKGREEIEWNELEVALKKAGFNPNRTKEEQEQPEYAREVLLVCTGWSKHYSPSVTSRFTDSLFPVPQPSVLMIHSFR